MAIEWHEELVELDRLEPYEKNPRIISEDAFSRLKKSLLDNGYHQRILADVDYRVIGGHQRIKALRELGFNEVKILLPGKKLTKKQYDRLLIQDNIEFGVFDYQMLSDDFDHGDLIEWGVDEDKLIAYEEPVDGLTDEDNVPEVPESPVSKDGDIWLLGNHRVMCGDSTDPGSVALLMAGEKADMWLTDPPYNVAYEGKTKDALTIQNDSMEDGDFRSFLVKAYEAADQFMRAGAVFYIWHADYEGYNFRGAAQDVGWTVRQCLIWLKQTMVMGMQDYHWKHESCLYGWKDGASHTWASDRKQTTVLEFNRPSRNAEHPTMKPVELFAYQVKNNTSRGDIVLDTFGGSGTTAIACERTKRRARLMELDPKYVDVIVRRWQEFTGKEAVHESGESFNVLADKQAAA